MLLRLKRSSEDFYIPAEVQKIVKISVFRILVRILYPDLALVAMKKVKIYIFALIPNFQK
jgi:hypothetical protein